jgi:hypothetical protein
MEGERESFSNAAARQENHSKPAVKAGNCARLDRGFGRESSIAARRN